MKTTFQYDKPSADNSIVHVDLATNNQSIKKQTGKKSHPCMNTNKKKRKTIGLSMIHSGK